MVEIRQLEYFLAVVDHGGYVATHQTNEEGDPERGNCGEAKFDMDDVGLANSPPVGPNGADPVEGRRTAVVPDEFCGSSR